MITGDVHDVLSKVHEAMPNAKHGSGLISLCFIDPFSADLRFDVIRNLAMHYKMDFLILLMLGRDIVTNFKQYYLSEGDERIARLIDDPEWRSEWRALGSGRKSLVRFILQKFDDAMVRIGYPARKPEESHSVKVYGKGVFLYSLVFYSKSKLGARFWKTATNNYGHQLALDIDP